LRRALGAMSVFTLVMTGRKSGPSGHRSRRLAFRSSRGLPTCCPPCCGSGTACARATRTSICLVSAGSPRTAGS